MFKDEKDLDGVNIDNRYRTVDTLSIDITGLASEIDAYFGVHFNGPRLGVYSAFSHIRVMVPDKTYVGAGKLDDVNLQFELTWDEFQKYSTVFNKNGFDVFEVMNGRVDKFYRIQRSDDWRILFAKNSNVKLKKIIPRERLLGNTRLYQTQSNSSNVENFGIPSVACEIITWIATSHVHQELTIPCYFTTDSIKDCLNETAPDDLVEKISTWIDQYWKSRSGRELKSVLSNYVGGYYTHYYTVSIYGQRLIVERGISHYEMIALQEMETKRLEESGN